MDINFEIQQGDEWDKSYNQMLTERDRIVSIPVDERSVFETIQLQVFESTLTKIGEMK